MVEEDAEPRVFVGIRLRPSSVAQVEALAARLKISKSAVYRRCFAAGLPIVEKQTSG